MCFPFFSFKKPVVRNYRRFYECSCDLCGSNFDSMESLITHMGRHTTDQINARKMSGYGTVRCNKCFQSFDTAADMDEHRCRHATSVIHGLSPIASSESLESVLIHEG